MPVDPLGLELQTIGSYPVGAGNWLALLRAISLAPVLDFKNNSLMLIIGMQKMTISF